MNTKLDSVRTHMEAMSVLLSHQYKRTITLLQKHRVLIPEEETKKRTVRRSMAFFVQPDDNVLIKSIDGSDKYSPITSLDFLNEKFSVTY